MFWKSTKVTACATLWLSLACAGKDPRASALTEVSGRSSAAPGAALGSASPLAPTQDAAVPEVVSDAGVSPALFQPVCGDGEINQASEQCDGLAGTHSCALLGFDQGVLTCNDDCTWDTSECTGTESCHDGRDNDGDGDADCADADCADGCGDPCLAPEPLPLGSNVTGTTTGRETYLSASCTDPSGEGPEYVYEVVAEHSGKLDVILDSSLPHRLSVRSACDVPESELACAHPTRLTLQAVAGEVFYVVVSGYSRADAGAYRLEVRQRQQACGDGVRDAEDEPGGYRAEECDDHNVVDGDGCDADCRVESTELEPDNDSFATAQPYVVGEPILAQIRPAGDIDHYTVETSATSSTLVVNAYNLGEGACDMNLQDSFIEVYRLGGDEESLVVRANDGGGGLCARAVASGLGPGLYGVRVRAADSAVPATFPYRFTVSVGVCGDGAQTLGEQCDDGNTAAGDGCSADCEEER